MGHEIQVSSDGTNFYNKLVEGSSDTSGNITHTLPANTNFRVLTSGTGSTQVVNLGATLPPGSVIMLLGDSYGFYPVVSIPNFTTGAQGTYTGPGYTFPQWLSTFYPGIPVYSYSVGSSDSSALARVLAGTTGSNYNYFWNATEYLNGAAVGAIGSITALPATLGPTNGAPWIWITNYGGCNDGKNGISLSSYQSNLTAGWATIRGYGSNVRIIGTTSPAAYSGLASTSSRGQDPYQSWMRTQLTVPATGINGLMDCAHIFTNYADANFFYSDGTHLISAGYWHMAKAAQGAICGVPYTPNLSGQSYAFLNQENNWNVAYTPNSGIWQLNEFAAPNAANGDLIYTGFGKLNSTSGTDGILGFIPQSSLAASSTLLGPDGSSGFVKTFGNGHTVIGAFTAADDGTSALHIPSSGDFKLDAGNVIADGLGKGLQVKEGTNAKQGTATLATGTVLVSDTAITASSRILVNGAALNASTAIGVLGVPTITAGTGFVITSYVPGGTTTQTGDLRTVNYEVFEPAP